MKLGWGCGGMVSKRTFREAVGSEYDESTVNMKVLKNKFKMYLKRTPQNTVLTEPV